MNVYNVLISVTPPDGPPEWLGRHGDDRESMQIAAHNEDEAGSRAIAHLPPGRAWLDRTDFAVITTVFERNE